MSDSHKAALAKGREEGRAIRRYLEALESSRPKRGRKRSLDGVQKRLATIDERLVQADPLSRVHLVQQKQELQAELAQADGDTDLAGLELDFTKVAKGYGERKGIGYSAWRTVGVSAAVLEKAGIPRTRG
jgi:multidrug resistance efflux pump